MFQISGTFKVRSNTLVLLNLLIPGIAFMLWYVLKQWNTALRDVMMLSFSSPVLCVRMHMHTLSLLPPSPSVTCTVTEFH